MCSIYLESLAKGLIYSFHVSSPSDQDLSLLLNPSLLPASLEAPTRPASPSSLADPSVLAQDHASPLLLGKTRWSHASLLHLPGLLELTVRPPTEPHLLYFLKAYYKFLFLIL